MPPQPLCLFHGNIAASLATAMIILVFEYEEYRCLLFQIFKIKLYFVLTSVKKNIFLEMWHLLMMCMLTKVKNN